MLRKTNKYSIKVIGNIFLVDNAKHKVLNRLHKHKPVMDGLVAVKLWLHYVARSDKVMAKLYDFVMRQGGKHMSKVNVFDVAKYILETVGCMSTMKLQKLIYYSQAWSLVWDERPLFKERIEAWANGPVCPDLFNEHRGLFEISPSQLKPGDSDKLEGYQRETIDGVLEFYGDKEGHWLSMLTHKERPWQDARKGYADGESCTEIITEESMQDYYGGIS